MYNSDLQPSDMESSLRLYEPTKWYGVSRGILVTRNGNQVNVECITQFCVLRWICHFFKQFGVNLYEKLSFHELLLSNRYEFDSKKIYKQVKDCSIQTTSENFQTTVNKIRGIIRNANIPAATSTGCGIKISHSVSEKKPEIFTDLTHPTRPLSLVHEKQIFELSSDEISQEIQKYSGQKTQKNDVPERLRKNAFFNRKQHLDEQTQEKDTTLFPQVQACEYHDPKMFQTTKDLHSAASTAEGNRGYNQDSFFIKPNASIELGNSKTTVAVYGVFDGHGKGGGNAANYVRDRFMEVFNSLSTKYTTKKEEEQLFFTFKDTMQQLHVNYLKHIAKEHLPPGGTTAVVAMVINGYVWILNVGDSRAILVNKDGVVCQASTDAKPADPRFLKKAKMRGGDCFNTGVARIYPPGLATPRSIGDDGSAENSKPIIAPNPKISRYPLEQFKGGYLVLACDGIWDVATSDQVGAVVHQESLKKKSLEDIALTIGKKALLAQSGDNVTVVVAELL